MAVMGAFEIQSDLAVEPGEFWSQCSLESVNWELAPIAKMTAPPAWANREISDWPVGAELFSSWILLFGVLPIDRHAFRLRETDCECGFNEASSSWINREWNHCREIRPPAIRPAAIRSQSAGCTVVDRVAFVCRVPVVGALLTPLYKFVFWHRHRRLRKKYGAAAAASRR
jgi:hypothetical protein